jgi:hypothetical protein
MLAACMGKGTSRRRRRAMHIMAGTVPQRVVDGWIKRLAGGIETKSSMTDSAARSVFQSIDERM